MTDVYLVAALRTPIGKFGDALASLTAATRSADTGVRITATLLHALRTRHKTVGLATLCISGGMGLSMPIKRV